MNSLKIYSILFIVLFSLFAETYSYVRGFDEDDAQALAQRFLRKRRSPHGHGVTGPVHTFVKTDKHANFKWGVRHHVGHKYAGN